MEMVEIIDQRVLPLFCGYHLNGFKDYFFIFISGYNPMILKYLEVGFDAKAFLSKLISEYDLAYKRNYEI